MYDNNDKDIKSMAYVAPNVDGIKLVWLNNLSTLPQRVNNGIGTHIVIDIIIL